MDVNELIKWGLLLLIVVAALWLILRLVGAVLSNRAYRQKQAHHNQQFERVESELAKVRQRHER